MTNARDNIDTDRRRRFVGRILLLLGTLAVVFGAHDVMSFEPLPAAVSLDTIHAFVDFKRYFGVWPGLMGVVSGVGFLVIGLLVLKGLVAVPSTATEE